MNGKNLDFEEVVVTIKKSERGFGFELRNGLLIVKVFPSKKKLRSTSFVQKNLILYLKFIDTPAFYSGIKVGDIILKVRVLFL